ncbi:DNA polymerase III subunit epsilon [Rhizobium populisoli]|uniref:DNA polymerase III subunit epsilon n=1 Tax=Rhizobium populisoli TaxID=2859785 RepID=UPI001FE92653|nr:DNA polymerase III subunit epsilon [Rhizobium populisoli]
MIGQTKQGTPIETLPIDTSPPRVRVIDLETGGNGLNDVCEIGWQDVVLDDDRQWQLTEERGALLVNPGRPMTPDTIAVHHILDVHVTDAPFWKEIAASVLRPPGRLDALAAHRAGFEQRYCTPRFNGGTPWICTWKSALRVWPEMPRFSNQMLRYQRMPKGLIHEIGLPAHRAMPDAYVTAHHLRDLLNETSLEQLLDWSREPGLLPRIPSGPDRGKGWDRLSDEKLQEFARDRDIDLRFSAETEIRRRGDNPKPESIEPAQRTLL